MSFEQFASLLQTSPLDRETKLFVIDLITMSDDSKLAEDVMELVLEWKRMDAGTVDTLHKALFHLSEQYQAQSESLRAKQQRAGMAIADQIASLETIQKIRQQLTSAV